MGKRKQPIKRIKKGESKEDTLSTLRDFRSAQLRALAECANTMDPFSVLCIRQAMYRTDEFSEGLSDTPPQKRTTAESQAYEAECDFLITYYAAIDKMIQGEITFPLPPEEELLQLTRRKR